MSLIVLVLPELFYHNSPWAFGIFGSSIKGVIMKPRINMITLGGQDLERAISFYEKGLGLPRKPFEGNVAFFELKG